MLPIDLYESESLLGHGVAGTTFKACKIGETQELAVKVVSLTNVANDSRIDLTKEVRSLKGIMHRNILPYTNIYISNRSIFIEMKLMKGRSLSDYLLTHRRHGNLSEPLIRDIVHQLAKGLDYLHRSCSRQIIHGNLVPKNIFYDNGTILIADYRLHPPLATVIPLEYTATRYPSPPEFRGNHVGSSNKISSVYTDKTDIWMLGNLIIELCTYKTNGISLLDTHLWNHSSSIKDLITDCLQENPAKRPTAADLVASTGSSEAVISSAASIRTSSSLNSAFFVQTSRLLIEEISLYEGVNKNIDGSKDVSQSLSIPRLCPTIGIAAIENIRARYRNPLLIQTPTPATSLVVAQNVQTDTLVYLETVAVKLISIGTLQRYMHSISQIRNNPCTNIINVNHSEKIGDLCICELEYFECPTLQIVLNEYHRAGVPIPEELIWNLLSDICSGLLHLRTIGASYGLLLPTNVFIRKPTVVIAGLASSWLVHRLGSSTRSSAPLHGLLDLILWMTNPSAPGSVSPNNLDALHQTAYSYDLLSLIKHIEKLFATGESFSPTECLTMIRNMALGHTHNYSINPFALGAPKQLLTLVDGDNPKEIEKYITRFNSCPPGALVSAIRKRRIASVATMCKEIAKRGLPTRIPICSGIDVHEPTPLMKEVWQSNTCDSNLIEEHMMVRYNGITALMISAHKGHRTCLINLASEMGIQSWSGTTALMFAVDSGHEKCVRLLLPEMGIQRHDGMTALMLAAQSGDARLVGLLLQERDLKNSAGLTAYDIAMDKGFEDCIKLLAPSEIATMASNIPIQV